MNNLLSIEEGTAFCRTLAKATALWDDNDQHLLNKVAVSLLFAERLSKTTDKDIELTWSILAENEDEPQVFSKLAKYDLTILACYITPLLEDVMHNDYVTWLDDVSEQHFNEAREFISYRRN